MNSDKVYTRAIISGRNILLGVSINLMLLSQTDNTQYLYFGTEAMFGGLYTMGDKKTWIDRVEAIQQEEENQTKFFDPKDMHPSGECVKIVEHFEGFRSETYYDSAGHLTLGHGFIHGIKPGDTITYEESKKRLLKELDKHYADAVRLHVKVPVTQAMFDALTCFTFNLGAGNLANSTLLKKLNRKDYEGAAAEFEKWVYAGGEVLTGLVRRRKAEQAMFRGEDWKEYIV